MASTVLGALWITWLAVWLLAARWSNKTVSEQPRIERLKHGAPTLLGAALLAANPRPPLGASLWSSGGAPAWVGLILTAVGIGWTFWARWTLGRLWSGIVTLKAEHKIVREGPYAYTRHPIYTGLLLALSATALARGTPAALLGVAVIASGFLLKIRQEEALLVSHFGDAYREYQAQVPALVPRIHTVAGHSKHTTWPPPEARAFFDAEGLAIERFARERNLKIEKWFKDIPAWALQFKHPRGGVGQIVVEPGPSESARLQSGWWKDDYDKQTRRYVWDGGFTSPRGELGQSLDVSFRRILAWTEADFPPPSVIPDNMWHRTWTKEQFAELDETYPEPRLS